MFEPVWLAVVGRPFDSVQGILKGHAAYTVKGEVYPGLVRCNEEAIVQGKIYLDLDAEAVKRLDRFEGAQYRRIDVVAHAAGKSMACQTYLFRSEFQSRLTQIPWDPEQFIARKGLDMFMRNYGGFEAM